MPPSRALPSLSEALPSPDPVSLFGVILGIDGPRTIPRAGPSLVLCVLHLADSSAPTGLELRLWGGDALGAASLRPMDAVHVGGVVACADKFERTFLKFRHDSIVTRVRAGEKKGGKEGELVERLLQWREEEFGALVRLAKKGRVRSRPWPRELGESPPRRGRREVAGAPRKVEEVELEADGVGSRERKVVALGEAARLRRGEQATLVDVRVVGVRLRAPFSGARSEDALKGLAHRVCEGCGRTRRAGQVVGRCGGCGGAPGGGWGWGWGEMYVVIGGVGEAMVVALAKGAAVGGLMVGVEPWEVASGAGLHVLRALCADEGGFRAEVKGGGDAVAVVQLERLMVC